MKSVRRLPAVIPVVVMFLILSVLLGFMCLPLGQKTADAVDGALDLRGGPMDEYVYALQGQWQFIYGEILTPEDFVREAGRAEIMELPSAWEEAGFPLNGCATYRLTIQVDNANPLMLYVPEIFSAYALWINGAPARSAGTVSDNPSTGRPLLENALVPMQAEHGIVELVIQVSNYHFMQSSLTLPLLLGKTDRILARFFRTRALYCIALGCILMAAFYHLALYIFRRREKVYLLFALMCVLCFTRFLMETNGINQYLQWRPLNMSGIRLYLVLLFMHTLSVTVFSLHVFDRKLLLRHKYAVVVITALGTALFCFIPLNASWSLIVSSLALLPLMVFIIIMAARSPVLRREKWTQLFFAALLLYISWGFGGKLFFESILYMPGLLINIFMIMAQSLVLSRSYADAFELVEETNANLEHIVDERTKDIRNVNNAMKELVGNISHDLKTPLTVLGINLQNLSRRIRASGDAENQRHVEVAYNKCLDLQRLIQNMFEASRIETGQALYEWGWTSVRELLIQAREKYSVFLEGEGLFLDIKYNKDAEIIVDPQKIWSVFDNIIYNAVRYTEKGGVISITAKTGDSAVDVVVTDTGSGIAPEHLPRIFERFYKVSPGRGGSGDSGLGLYIVKSVMEGIGGSVRAESEPGKGTSVILTFRCGR